MKDRKLLWKLDRTLIPWYDPPLHCRIRLTSRSPGFACFISPGEYKYLAMVRARHLRRWDSFLDRTNVGNAKLGGLQKDLKMTDGQYNAALSIFFVSYSVFEPLTQILLKRFRPSIFLPCTMILWVCGPWSRISAYANHL